MKSWLARKSKPMPRRGKFAHLHYRTWSDRVAVNDRVFLVDHANPTMLHAWGIVSAVDVTERIPVGDDEEANSPPYSTYAAVQVTVVCRSLLVLPLGLAEFLTPEEFVGFSDGYWVEEEGLVTALPLELGAKISHALGIDESGRPSVFLSHTKADKPFVRKLAKDLENQGVRYWFDDAEIAVGESLIDKIREGIDSMDYLAVVLSPESVESAWVQRELDVAMNQEIAGHRVKVLPLMYRKCELPGFLLGKRYADFTDDELYPEAFEDLLRSMKVVFNRLAFAPPAAGATLGEAIDKAWKGALPLLSRPFHRPYQYMGMSLQQSASATGRSPNEAGNIVLDTDDCEMLLEAEGNFINYVEVKLKATAPHRLDQEFDSEVVLGALSISPAELELVRKQTHSHTYYDHKRRLKISVSCLSDGAPLSVVFSSKYYGM